MAFPPESEWGPPNGPLMDQAMVTRGQKRKKLAVMEAETYAKRKPEIRYCCGLIFNKKMTKVILIKKNRPNWQKGYLNGIGGHLEQGEGGKQGMARECKQECGLDLPDYCWQSLASISGVNEDGDRYICWFYYSINLDKVFDKAKTLTDEEVWEIDLTMRRKMEIVCGLDWLIPLAIYDYNKTEGESISI